MLTNANDIKQFQSEPFFCVHIRNAHVEIESEAWTEKKRGALFLLNDLVVCLVIGAVEPVLQHSDTYKKKRPQI